MSIQRFQRKPDIFEAIKWDGTDARADEIHDWTVRPVLGGMMAGAVCSQFLVLGEDDAYEVFRCFDDDLELIPGNEVERRIAEGASAVIYSNDGSWANVKTGDWIVNGGAGGFYALDPDTAAEVYIALDRASGIDVEIYESVKGLDELAAIQQQGVIAPGRLRINGQEIAWPAGHPPVIHEMKIGDPDAAVVTLTVFARSIKVHAEAKR